MIFKAYYQEDKSRNPRRETTRSLYLELDATEERAGVIIARDLLAKHTAYHVEFIEMLSPEIEAYERENADFEITSF